MQITYRGSLTFPCGQGEHKMENICALQVCE
jgi:hypothetical protein